MGAIEAKEAASFRHKTDLAMDRATKGYYAKEDLDGHSRMRKNLGTIKSKQLDKDLLVAVADSLKDDGKIDINEAKTVILPKLADGPLGKSELTCNERWTIRYCIGEFKFDEEARHFLFHSMRKMEKIADMDGNSATDPSAIDKIMKGPTLEELGGEPAAKRARTEGADELILVDGMMLDKGMLLAARSAADEDGVIDALEAIQIFKEAADGGGFSTSERWTFRFILSAYLFTDAANYFLLESLSKCQKTDE